LRITFLEHVDFSFCATAFLKILFFLSSCFHLRRNNQYCSAPLYVVSGLCGEFFDFVLVLSAFSALISGKKKGFSCVAPACSHQLQSLQTPMKKPKQQNEPDLSQEMWINPKSNIKGDRGNRAFDDRLGVPSSARYLELADYAWD
jgi:hypothetical protein